jgi:hypothetical protein
VPAATLASVAAIGGLLVPALPAAAADPPVPPGPDGGVELVIEKISPAVIKPTSKVTISGTVANRGTAPLREGEVSLDVRRRPFTYRAELAAAADNRTPLRDAVDVAEYDLPGKQIAPGASVAWKFTVPVKDLKLPGNGVYALGVRLTGRDAGSDREVDALTTFLPYLPEPKGYTPTRLSWLWPLIGDPVRGADGAFPSPHPYGDFGASTRVGDLTAAPGDHPVAWMIDPQLLDDARTLAATHRVRGNGEKTVKTPGDDNAERWLMDVRRRLTGKPVAATPYADPDLLGLIGAGADRVVDQALARSRATTTALLGRQSDTTVIWPPSGVADIATLAALRRLGARTVVLSGDQFPVLDTLSYTPTGRANVATEAGDLEVLIADSGLTAVLDRDLRAPGAFALAQQQLLAETALITLERPNAARAVLMTPPRRWDPPAGAAKRLLDAFAAAPWMTATGLDSFSRTRVPAELVDADLLDGPAAAVRRFRPNYASGVLAAAEDADAVRSVLVDDSRLIDEHESAVLRAASMVRIAAPADAWTYLRTVRQWVRGDRDKVKIIGRSLVTLSGSRGTIPVTIQNGLSEAIRIRPTITPLVSGRLRVRSPELLTIAPGRNRSVNIPAEASANGITRVRVELRDAAGNPFGRPVDLRVNVTNYGSVGLIVVLGGGGLLFAVAIVRNVRRVRRHRHRARGQNGSAPAASGTTDRSDAEEPVQL